MNAINIYAWSSVAKASNDQKEFVTVTAATKTKNCNENEKKCAAMEIFFSQNLAGLQTYIGLRP
jgi:hypothetical protein